MRKLLLIVTIFSSLLTSPSLGQNYSNINEYTSEIIILRDSEGKFVKKVSKNALPKPPLNALEPNARGDLGILFEGKIYYISTFDVKHTVKVCAENEQIAFTRADDVTAGTRADGHKDLVKCIPRGGY